MSPRNSPEEAALGLDAARDRAPEGIMVMNSPLTSGVKQTVG